jgi:hypothetical protein
VKWRFAGQRAAAVLNCPARADIVRASALCRVVWRGDDVRQIEKRLIDAKLSVAHRLNPPGIDAGGKARVLKSTPIHGASTSIGAGIAAPWSLDVG